jgi:hypothetical protein
MFLLDLVPPFTKIALAHLSSSLVLSVDKGNKSKWCWVTKPRIQKLREKGKKYDFVLFLLGSLYFFPAILLTEIYIQRIECL